MDVVGISNVCGGDVDIRSILRAVHVDQGVGIPINLGVITPHYDSFCSQPLRLPCLVYKLATSPLDQRDPRLVRFRFVRAV